MTNIPNGLGSHYNTTGALIITGKVMATDTPPAPALKNPDRSALKANGKKLGGNGVFQTNGR